MPASAEVPDEGLNVDGVVPAAAVSIFAAAELGRHAVRRIVHR